MNPPRVDEIPLGHHHILAPFASAKSDSTFSASQSIAASPPSSPSSNRSIRIGQALQGFEKENTNLELDIAKSQQELKEKVLELQNKIENIGGERLRSQEAKVNKIQIYLGSCGCPCTSIRMCCSNRLLMNQRFTLIEDLLPVIVNLYYKSNGRQITTESRACSKKSWKKPQVLSGTVGQENQQKRPTRDMNVSAMINRLISSLILIDKCLNYKINLTSLSSPVPRSFSLLLTLIRYRD
ncbi:hypothetical protein L1987_12132 [Smallanthus sonchifolius]|uniref:Uncharacterized protein n=1 Tax=Smallanthus sonchifolius TaxID=185202 RepID=A0ACB9JF84_9ASTR|nr:hypothetical protein L1987_12132 [Smallanthus sonchifolius]